MSKYEVGKRIRFPLAGHVYRITAMDQAEQTVTFARDSDPEDCTTETMAVLDAVDVTVLPGLPAPQDGGADKGFRVTVEDLETGDKQAMIVQPGDYMLIPFAPCHHHYTQRHASGTVQITLKGHAPQGPATVEATAGSDR